MPLLGIRRLTVSFRTPGMRFTSRRCLQLVLLLLLVLPSWTKREKNQQILKNYSVWFKFFLFWWCAIVVVIMTTFIIDNFCWRFLGAAHVKWSTSFAFDGRASREAYWKQFVDPSSWSSNHPIMESADLCMVQVLRPADAPAEADAANKSGDLAKEYTLADPPSPEVTAEAQLLKDEIQAANGIRSEPSKRMQPVDFGPFKVGLGLVLRHKATTDQRSGLFYCSRECMQIETPEEGPWQFVMKTVEVGVGHVFLPGTEEVTVMLWPPAEDGSVLCDMEGTGAVQSRIFRWWYKLSVSSADNAKAMLALFNERVGHAKKAE